jgi:hypothetical protein
LNFQLRALWFASCAAVLVLIGCASGGNTIKLASGKSVEVVRVEYHAYQRYGGYPIQYSLTIRYKTALPLESSKLKSEVTDVWKYFTPMIDRRHWDTVTIEPMTFGFIPSWRSLAYQYRKTSDGWSDPWRSPPTEPAWGVGTIPQ